MEMSRKSLYRVGIIVVLLTAGLSIVFLVWRQRTNENVLIGEEQAIQNAIQACDRGYGLQPVEQPTEFHTELTTYGKAVSDPLSPPDRETPVWVVTMKGRWMLVGGPPPAEDNPGPFYWDECTIVINAVTGESLSMPIE